MSDQEQLWQGQFGTSYHQRNKQTDRLGFWLDVLKQAPMRGIDSVLEVGAGQGDNLAALRLLNHRAKFTGCEINPAAAEAMRNRGFAVLEGSFLGHHVLPKADLVITRGFLIHVPEQDLMRTLKRMHDAANFYICIAEYYSPVRREIPYRGYANALWADDFALRLLKSFDDLKLLDYGFHYHLDGGHDLTWFLLEKRADVS